MLSADDHAEILQVLAKYCAAIDLRRWALMDEVFLPDADIYMNGELLKPAARGVAVIRDSIECCSFTQHLIGSTLVETDGERVTVTTQVRAWHRGGEGDKLVIEAMGHYRDRFVCAPQGWRIARREENVPVMMGDMPLFAAAAPTLERMFAETAAEFPQA
jgi:hypothetical protein